MLAAVAYRGEGSPPAAAADGDRAVETGQWYTDAAIWLRSVSASSATDDIFLPDEDVTNGWLAAVLYEAAAVKYGAFPVAEEVSIAFTDADMPLPMQEAAIWAVSSGLVQSGEYGLFSPYTTITRAEIAEIYFKYIRLFE